MASTADVGGGGDAGRAAHGAGARLAVVDPALAARLQDPAVVQGVAPLADAVASVHFRRCDMHRHFANTAVVITVFTQPQYRRRGWSAYLYGLVLALCRQAGVATVQASVHSENAAAKALHRAFGFRTFRQDVGYLEQLVYL